MTIKKNKMKRVLNESYRSLRTSIQYTAIDKDLKTIVITSSIPGEGKSTVASNLAFSMSEMNKKVLLIDGDLRKPTIHGKLNLSNQIGLTDRIVHKLPLTEVIQKINDHFHVITAGKIPPNPTEILGSESMVLFLEKLSVEYDHIIIDTPPLLSVTDPQLIAAKADATLLVVRENYVKAKLVLESYKELQKVNAHVIGAVLNDSIEKSISYSKYYYEYDVITDTPTLRRKKRK